MRINMTEEIYLAPGGIYASSLHSAPYCAFGKILHAAGKAYNGSYNGSYNSAKQDLNAMGITSDEYCKVVLINDGECGGYKSGEPNHYRALKLAIQLLQEKGHEVILPEVVFAEDKVEVHA